MIKTKTLILCLFLGVISLSVTAKASSSLDLEKFIKKAEKKLTQFVGTSQITGSPTLLFRDGAGSTDMEPLYDYAAFFYIVEVKPGVFPDPNLKLAYRLWLNGQEDIILLNEREESYLFDLRYPGTGSLVLTGSQADGNQLVATLQKLAPTGTFTYLDAINIIIYEVELKDWLKVIAENKKHSFVYADEIQEELYRIPFNFDSPITITQTTGVINPDQYRGITQQLKAYGMKFHTNTTIPADLQ